jgi:hypothetical protein
MEQHLQDSERRVANPEFYASQSAVLEAGLNKIPADKLDLNILLPVLACVHCPCILSLAFISLWVLRGRL